MSTTSTTPIPSSRVQIPVLVAVTAATAMAALLRLGPEWTPEKIQSVGSAIGATQTVMTPGSWKVDTSSVSSPAFADRYEDVARAYPTAGSTTRESATSAVPTTSSSIAAESARAYQGFFDGLGLLKSLDEDWNGYGASPADPAAVRAAESLVPALPYDVANPLVGIAEKGSVYFKFTRAGKRYVLTIEPRKLHLLIDSGMGQYSYLDDVRFNGKNIPESVREAIMESRHA